MSIACHKTCRWSANLDDDCHSRYTTDLQAICKLGRVPGAAPARRVVAADAVEEGDGVQRLREGGPPAVLGLLLGAVVGQAAVAPGPDDQLAVWQCRCQYEVIGQYSLITACLH